MERGPRHNNHHLLYYRRIWDAMPQTKKLRALPQLQIDLRIPEHVQLHRDIEMVPPLPVNMAMRAYALFNEFGDAHEPIENVQNFMRSIETAMQDPREKELNRGMGEMTLLAIEQQLPYIREGYVDLSKYSARGA